MVDETLGDRLRKQRRDRNMTQEQLAEASGVSLVMIQKTEQGRRVPRLPILLRLANVLDIPLSDLVDNRPRLNGHSEGASVLAVRDALLNPALLPDAGLDEDHGEPLPLGQLQSMLAQASQFYWSGEFAKLVAMTPAFLAEASYAAAADGPEASAVLAQAYDLSSALMVHMGKEDLAAIGAERAIAAAKASGDELLWAMEFGNYAWVMLHQGRLDESEQLAVTVAQRVEPSFSASDTHVAVFGSLLMTALAPAAAAGRGVEHYVSMASAAAAKVGRRVPVYQTSFAPATVHMQVCHANAVLGEPGKALLAAQKIGPGDLTGISWGRHLLDVAQAHVDAHHPKAAVTALNRARTVSPTWFRHQGVARSLVDNLYEQERRVSPELRELGASVDPKWYAPYYRHE
jgi:transcriptional regulator with XRE-family HTH domain